MLLLNAFDKFPHTYKPNDKKEPTWNESSSSEDDDAEFFDAIDYTS